MNKFLKVSFLLFLIAIPIGIVLFLQFFGENRFDIPVYYEDGVADEFVDCGHKKGSFTVPDSLVHNNKVTLVNFYHGSKAFGAMALRNQVRRLKELFHEGMTDIIIYSPEQVDINGVELRVRDEVIVERIMLCGFIAQEFNQYVLVDKNNRIRGYYGTDLDEIDRLVVELKILLENGGS